MDPAADLPLGDRSADDKADEGDWGDALNCKPIPDLPALVDPRITISLSGLTLHLFDRATGFDKVFPIGPGQIEEDENQPSFGESKSYYPVIATGGHDFALSPNTANPCRTWWTDPETGEESPVFAGLPFMPFYGPYAIHGPIDRFRAPNGGSLRRGYVSHGCVRLQAADILEIYGRTKTLASVPVHLQREPERLPNGARVDLAARWIGSECGGDADCNFEGGVCHPNAYGGRGFCTARCDRFCPDRADAPMTFCVADRGATNQGMCVSQVVAQNPDCRAFGQMIATFASRMGDPGVSAEVCLPGSRGSIGDPCLADGDCRSGASCARLTPRPYGYCSESCAGICPDEPGAAMTACAVSKASDPSSPMDCLRSCTPESNASECEGGTVCVLRDPTNPKDRRSVCRPLM